MTIVTFTFELWPPKSIGFSMVNMSAKFDEEEHNGFVCIRFTAYCHTCPLWPWPLTSKINRVHPLTKVHISAKFDEKIHNGLVSIVFTSLSPYMSIMTVTFDLWPSKSIWLVGITMQWNTQHVTWQLTVFYFIAKHKYEDRSPPFHFHWEIKCNRSSVNLWEALVLQIITCTHLSVSQVLNSQVMWCISWVFYWLNVQQWKSRWSHARLWLIRNLRRPRSGD